MYEEQDLESYQSGAGLQLYRMPVRFPALGKQRVVFSDMPILVVHKAALVEKIWQAQLDHRNEVKRKRLGLEMNAKRPDLKPTHKFKIAESRTALSQEEWRDIAGILSEALKTTPRLDWEKVKDYPDYTVPRPEPPEFPPPPEMPRIPREPLRTDEAFIPQLDAMDKLIRSRREEKEAEALARYEAAHKQWEKVCQHIMQHHQAELQQHQQVVRSLKAQHEQALALWEQARKRYIAEREQCKPIIDAKQKAYRLGEPYAVLDYCDLLLTYARLPDLFPHSYDMDYYELDRGIQVEYLLPPLRSFPWLYAVEYDPSTDSFQERLLTEEQRTTVYATALCDTVLRVMYELFAGDEVGRVDQIHFDGYMFPEDKPRPGTPPTLVVTLRTTKQAFLDEDLTAGDPADVITRLGGIFHTA